MKPLAIPQRFKAAAFRDAYGYAPDSERSGFITNCPDTATQEDLDALSHTAEEVALWKFRQARQAAYEASVTIEDQADATFKHLAWAQMRAGQVRADIEASGIAQAQKNMLLAILSCFNAIQEVDDIISIRNQIKANIRLEDFQ
jgi:hypothetical protein